MKAAIFNNIHIKLFCLLIAAVLWFYISWPIYKDTSATLLLKDVPIQIKGVSEYFDIKVQPENVDVKVKVAKESEISLKAFETIRVEFPIQFIEQEEGSKSITILAEEVILPEFLKFVSVNPNSVSIQLIRK